MWLKLGTVLLGATLAVSAACGGDDRAGSTSPTPTPVATQAATPGTITFSAGTITGQTGKVLLVFASPSGGGPVARACVPIGSERFTAPATVLTDMAASGDPCGPATPATVFATGSYTVTAGVYAPPASKPEKESTQTVQVRADAPATVQVDGAALSR